jgi:3'(2'), 5'-bisphosphate nucleotidase
MDINNLPFESSYSFIPTLLRAIKEAGKEIMQVYGRDFSSREKGENGEKGPVTEADLVSNKILMEKLAETGIPVLSEEENDSLSFLGSDKVWIIDPLDGTKDFINKTGEFCVMVGLVEKESCVLGCILEPVTGAITIAEKGKGAFKSVGDTWKQIKVNTNNKIGSYRAVTSRNHLSTTEKNILDALHISEHRPHGSCGLKIIQICCGNAEMYFTTTNKINQWDTAAGSIIIQEAGGIITDYCGDQLEYNKTPINHERGVFVSNGMNHSIISTMIKKSFSSQ